MSLDDINTEIAGLGAAEAAAVVRAARERASAARNLLTEEIIRLNVEAGVDQDALQNMAAERVAALELALELNARLLSIEGEPVAPSKTASYTIEPSR